MRNAHAPRPESSPARRALTCARAARTCAGDPLASVVSIRQTSNRGPLLLVHSKAKQLGYLDELNYMLANDDHDFHCRAFLEKGWVTGHIWVRFFTNLKEGGVRLSRTQAASDKTPCVCACTYRLEISDQCHGVVLFASMDVCSERSGAVPSQGQPARLRAGETGAGFKSF